MYLKSLELHGFKSFPNRTVLNFERGATVVIGPNGSGKSNLSDAMRWVLGEMSTKSIRGSKMEDVIFGGADSRRPMGFAEVTVTFDNTDGQHRVDSPYDEISVTRRYYRTGDSEYFLNKKQVRLRDIHELFMNTGIGRDGYSIIGQGKIAEILSKKSEDRRNIFEEAAGISKYRYRKTESERKLAETEANMLRLSDIIAELSGRIGPLERDAEKARRYLDLYEQKKRADVSLWLFDTANMDEEEKKAETALLMSRHELEMAEDTVRSLERQYEKLFEDTQKTKLESEKLLEEIREKDRLIGELDAAYKVSESETEHTRSLIALAEASRAETTRRRSAAEEELAALRRKAEAADAEIGELENAYALLAQKQQAADERIAAGNEENAEALREKNELEAQAAAFAVRLGVLEGGLKTDSDTEEKASAGIREQEEEKEKYLAEAAAAQETVNAYESKAAEAAKRLETLETERAAREKKAEELADRAAAVLARRDAQTERADALSRMEEHFEGYSNAVRAVMRDWSEGRIAGAGKIYGPLSKLITVKPEHAAAIETALAANIQNIAVDTEETAKAAIRHLKKNNGGRATFCPVSSVSPQEDTAELKKASGEPGCIGYADTLVSCDKRFSDIISRYLGRTLIFSDLDAATAAASSVSYRIKAVTLDGQVINPGGSFTGGSVRSESGMLTRAARIEALKAEAAAANAEYEALAGEREELSARLTEAEATARRLREDREMLLALAGAEKSTVEAAKAKAESALAAAARFREDLDRIRAQQRDAAAETAELKEKHAQLCKRIEAIEAQRAERFAAVSEEQEEKELLRKKESETLVSLAEKRRDAENAREAIRAAEERIEGLGREFSESEALGRQYEKTLADLEDGRRRNKENRESVLALRAELFERRSALESDGSESEKKQNDLYRRIREKTAEKETFFRSHTKNEEQVKRLAERRERMTEQLAEEYQLTYSTAAELGYPPLKAEEREETLQLQKKLRGQIKALGNVNVGAIEEFAEVKTRYDEISGQYADLTEARAKLTDFISSVEGEMKRRFLDTFEQVNGYFGETFAELFGGGRAELLLTDPDDLLGCGIDIKAAPPGKIVKSLSLLSGGEQAFVAIALFFAVLKVNPSPFCILDEIESALDEVNVVRFADYIKKFSGDTQFILITHRRGTMEAADRMYGVTMPEQGVSRVIALNVSDFDTRSRGLGDGVF
ncbi:MAG: chromosome segregation protein SMC [Clostridia bacterium]|nr:chromosome segregation protein SMC [Clostridia bacterium]